MSNFDTYVPQAWLRDGLVSVSRRAKDLALKRSNTNARRGAHWKWITAAAFGAVLGGAPAYCTTNEILSTFGNAVVVDKVSLAQQLAPAVSSEVPEGYWDALREVVRHSEKIPENTDFSDPPVLI